MKQIRTTLLAFAVLVALPVVASARQMYARMDAEVREGRSLSARVVARLKQGDTVRTLERSGRHYRVSVNGTTGWIYFNKLTEDKPEDISALLGGGPATGGAELSEMEAGGAVRGLSPEAEKYSTAKDIPEWAVPAVENMQARKISADELESFAREGGLGEYGEESP